MALSASQSDDLYNEIHRKTWVRRTAGFLGGATLGGIYGAIIGTVAAFLPYIFAALQISGAAASAAALGLPALAAVAASAALFAGIGAGIGILIGADVGANAGSNAASTALELEQQKDIGGRERSLQKEQKPSGMVVWKAAPIIIPLFAVAGALMATNPLTATAITLLGFKGATAAVAATATTAAIPASAATTAAIAASATIFGMFGSLMTIKNSVLHNKLSNFYYKLLTDKKPVQEQAMQPQLQAARAIEAPSIDGLDSPVRSFSDRERRAYLAGVLHGEESAPQNSIVIR